MKIIKYLVLCFSTGNFYKVGISDDPNEATDIMKRDVLNEMENAGYFEDDEEYICVKAGNYDTDNIYIDVTTAEFSEADMYWTIMQIDIEVQ